MTATPRRGDGARRGATPPAAWPPGDGEMAARIRAHDWAATPLGLRERWPEWLRTCVDLVLDARQPMFVAAGADLRLLYNDACVPFLGGKHPRALSAPFRPTFAEIGDDLRPLLEATLAGRQQALVDRPFRLPWRPAAPEGWFTFSWTPVRDARGAVAGFLAAITETTETVRAQAALRESEARHRTLFDAVDEGVCLFERLPPRPDGRRDYRYLAMNPAMRAMFGVPDLSGRSIRDHFPDEVEAWYDDYDRVLATGRPIRFERESVPQGLVLEMFVTRLEDGSGRRLLAVMQDVTERRRAEAALRASEAALAAERERLAVAAAVAAERRALLQRTVALQEEERRRVAHEVHDGVTQLAHAAALRLDALTERLAPGATVDAADLADLARARDLARRAAADARRLIAGLRPEALDALGLTEAVRQEVDALRAEGWRAAFADGDPALQRLPPEAEITLFRVAQEALTNVRKHAGPGMRVRVRLAAPAGGVRLTVQDWGRGFDPAAAGAAAGERVGLVGMRERVGLVEMRERLALLGGTLTVRSAPGRGTTVRADLPRLPAARPSPSAGGGRDGAGGPDAR